MAKSSLMKQQPITQQLDTIWQVLKTNFEQGASLEEISSALPFELEKRTLQRRLDLLKEQGAVKAYGKTKATLYMADASDYRAKPKMPEPPRISIPFSGAASLVLQSISQPHEKRYPVSVNTFFLDAYRPNIDHYLTEEERTRLQAIGKTKFRGTKPGNYARGVVHRLVPDLAFNSVRLEGGEYSLPATEQLFEQGQFAEDVSVTDHQCVLNHKDAIEFIVNNDEVCADRYTMLNLHALLSNNLLLNPSLSGTLRVQSVEISGSVYRPASSPKQIEDRFNLLLEKASQITDPFEQAFFLMVQLPYLQPFADMNAEVSRLAANIPLVKNNLMPLVFNEMPQELYTKGLIGVYELNRLDVMKELFIWGYEQSAKVYTQVRHSFGEPDQFRMKYRDQIREVIYALVSGNMLKEDAGDVIRQYSFALASIDQFQFSELVKKELNELHEGNIARYMIKPSEFRTWKQSREQGSMGVAEDPKVIKMAVGF